MRPDSLIFDMDGTLWDAVATYADAWNIYFEQNNIALSVSKQQLDSLMGMEESAYLEAVIPQFTPDERKAIYKQVIDLQYNLIDQQGGNIYEGVIAGLQQLSTHYKLFIVSNCPAYTIQHFIGWAKIGNFICDSLAHGQNFKPKHENIKALIRKHSLQVPWYIGDTSSDSKQSSIAKIPFIFMTYGFGKCDDYYLKFDSFNHFTEYLCKDAN